MASEEDKTWFCTKWMDLEVSDIIDIYSVQKALKFGQFQRAEYEVDEFLQDLEAAEKNAFGETPCTLFFKENVNLLNMSFYPEYMVNDDVFQVLACHFAVSAVVHELTEEGDCDELQVRSVVVPGNISSRYDVNDKYHPTIRNIRDFLYNVGTTYIHQSYLIRPDITKVPDLTKILLQMVKSAMEINTKNVVIIFDRQNVEDTGHHSVHIFQCSDWSELNELETNYFISFDFHVCGLADGNVLRCWLTFGMGQRLRFYPEHAIWILPHLFMRPTTMSMYKVVEILYGDDYKHGWRVNLDDGIFNKYYHIITGYEHISNNYHRPRDKVSNEYDLKESGLRDHLENTLSMKHTVTLKQYVDAQLHDSDSILQDLMNDDDRIDQRDSNIASLMISSNANLRRLKFNIYRFENIECKSDAVRDVDDCKYIDKVIENLQKFHECGLEIDALSVVDFTLESILNAFDHMIKVHDFLSDDIKKRKIQNYISKHVQCPHDADCVILSRHSERTRERESIEEKTEDLLHVVDSLCEPVADALDSLHCYVLHENDHLYRLLSNKNGKFQSRFGTEAVGRQRHDDEMEEEKDDEKEAAPLGINFGLNVLQWLPHGESPLHDDLRDEITRNPDSTIDRALYNHYEMVCIAKIKGTAYTLYEMLCLKLYSDTTELQALLRRAHWTVALKAVRKRYYQWAMGLYKTHLYHATPIPAASGKNKPCKLYHGLSQMFIMDQELPIYNGPFSTTIARSVATTFCKEQGLIWLIQSTFANPLRFCLGISMEWISGFKHEREVLLYNQFLPIQKTETFDDDTGVLIEHFVHSLLSRNAPINDPESFYNHLGVRYSDDWIAAISNHKLLYAESKCEGMTVLERLKKELHIRFFHIFDWTEHWAIDERNNTVKLIEFEKNDNFDISQFDLGVGTNGVVAKSMEPMSFDDVTKVSIPWTTCMNEKGLQWNTLKFDIFTRAKDESFGFERVHSIILPKYVFTEDIPLCIEESVDIPAFAPNHGFNGVLQLHCASDLHVSQKSAVMGRGRGRQSQGAEVRFISVGSFQNDGTICCDGIDGGSGGVIYIVSDTFINNGSLQSIPNGQIHIFCREYTNNGTIHPEPTVIKTEKYQNIKSGELVVGDYPLSVINYIFHCAPVISASDGIADFFRKLNISPQTELIQCIVDQRTLFEEIGFLADNHNMKFFDFYRAILDMLVLNDDHSLVLRDAASEDDGQSQISIQPIFDYIFMVRLGIDDQSEKVEYRFDEISEFEIQCKSALAQSVIKPLEIWAKPVDGSLEFVRIKSVLKPQYIFNRKTSLQISESLVIPPIGRKRGVSGAAAIRSDTDIIIEQNVVISGSELISNTRGPGIRVISKQTVANQGTLCSNGLGDGDGGDIYIVADCFVNDGVVETNPNGQIRIFCRKFINNGVIAPQSVSVNVRSDQRLPNGDPYSFIDYFLCALLSSSDSQSQSFSDQSGVAFETEWIPLILSHDLWIENSEEIIKKLSALDIAFFAAAESMKIDSSNNVTLQFDDEGNSVDLSAYVFAVGVGAQKELAKPSDIKDSVIDQLTDICVNEIIPTLKSRRENRDLLTKDPESIPSVLKDLGIHSLNVNDVTPREFALKMEKRTGNDGVYRPAIDLWKALQKKMNAPHIISAIRDEMNAPNSKSFVFNKAEDFAIPFDKEATDLVIFIKAADDSFDFVPIRTMDSSLLQTIDSDEDDDSTDEDNDSVIYHSDNSVDSDIEDAEEAALKLKEQLRNFEKIAATGQLFLRYPSDRRRKPQDRSVMVSFDNENRPKQISWGSGHRHIDFSEILYVAWGHWTPVFEARKEQLKKELCFSVVGKQQILDVQAQSKEMAELWVKGLRKLIGMTDEESNRRAKEGLKSGNLPGHNRNKDVSESKRVEEEHKKREKNLNVLQQDLFVMTTTTVFRNLEEERIWLIDWGVRERFNAKSMYKLALREKIPWRQWNHWIRDKIVTYLRENNRIDPTRGHGQYGYQQQMQQHGVYGQYPYGQ